MSSYLALDFEGTGLLKTETEDPSIQPGIVEIGAVCVFDGGIINEYSQLINPEVHFEEEAQRITGIKEQELYGMPTFREAFYDLSNFFVGHKHLITFNGPGYDIPLLYYNLKRYGLETKFPWPPKQYDLMKIATDVLNLQGKTGNKPPTLVELYSNLFDQEFENHHRALSDARATAFCAHKMIEMGHLRI